ncbi:hypothetical protein SAMN05428975_0066 [Mucilaginibacter sp. OK268]|nr:hypothetical protein SAMN05428975_0066 [Mucilaginibacter sp. OK268]
MIYEPSTINHQLSSVFSGALPRVWSLSPNSITVKHLLLAHLNYKITIINKLWKRNFIAMNAEKP